MAARSVRTSADLTTSFVILSMAAPLRRPTLGALGLLTFLGTWNQYLWPQAVITDKAHRTIQIGSTP